MRYSCSSLIFAVATFFLLARISLNAQSTNTHPNSASKDLEYLIKIHVNSKEILNSLNVYLPVLEGISEIGYGKFVVNENRYQRMKPFLNNVNTEVSIILLQELESSNSGITEKMIITGQVKHFLDRRPILC